MRGVLGIPEEVVPLTYKKTKKNYTGVEEREGLLELQFIAENVNLASLYRR